jgi:hypothetical protein
LISTGRSRNQLAVGPEFEAVVRDDGAFLGETLHMLRLLLQVGERNEQREVGILVPRGLEHAVEDRLHPLPDGVAVRLDHHAAAHRRLLGEVGGPHHLLIPLGIVLGAGGADGGGGHGVSAVR